MTRKTAAFLLIATLVTLSASQAAARHPAIDALASAKGALIVSAAWAGLNTISTFLWAFDWTRAGASNSTSATIQEIGGLTSAAESLILGVMVPFYLYQYKAHLDHYHQKIQALQQQIGENAV